MAENVKKRGDYRTVCGPTSMGRYEMTFPLSGCREGFSKGKGLVLPNAGLLEF